METFIVYRKDYPLFLVYEINGSWQFPDTDFPTYNISPYEIEQFYMDNNYKIDYSGSGLFPYMLMLQKLLIHKGLAYNE